MTMTRSWKATRTNSGEAAKSKSWEAAGTTSWKTAKTNLGIWKAERTIQTERPLGEDTKSHALESRRHGKIERSREKEPVFLNLE